MIYKIISLFFLFTCILSNARAIITKLAPKHTITISDGLAHNGVTSILEDSKGYVWIGTYDGLNKYDGYEFITLKNTLEKRFLINNRVLSLHEDKNGNIWIGTEEGISLYDYSKQQFSDLFSSQLAKIKADGPVISKIIEDTENGIILCLSEGDGIFIFSDNYKLLYQIKPPIHISDPQHSIDFFDGHKQSAQKYLLSSSVGLWELNIGNKSFTKLLENEITYSKTLLPIGANKYVIALNMGMAILDYQAGEEPVLNHPMFTNFRINKTILDTSNSLWIGTLQEGLIKIDKVDFLSRQDKIHYSSYGLDNDLLRISCAAIIKDECWIGTYDKGVLQFDSKPKAFKFYHAQMGYQHGIRSNNIFQASPLDADRVYLKAQRGGLGLFNTKTQRFEPFTFNEGNKKDGRILSVFVDKQQAIWIRRGKKGVFRVKPGSRTLEHIDLGELNPLLLCILEEDYLGYLWILSSNDIILLNSQQSKGKKSIQALSSHPFLTKEMLSNVKCVYSDHQTQSVWIGTKTNGLYRIILSNNGQIEDAEVRHYMHDPLKSSSLSSNLVSCVIRLPNGQLWIGTEQGGICEFKEQDGQAYFKSYSEKDGLSNHVVKSIFYDDNDHLWISTNKGLNRFDTKEHTFKNFHKEDGLDFEDFVNTGAIMANGNILFAGLGGLCYFNPKELDINESIPPFELSKLKVFNKLVLPGDTLNNRVLFTKRLAETPEIELKYNENVFTLQLNALHFSNPRNYRLKYKLLPLDKEWIEVSSDKRDVYFKGLQPGRYEFIAQASNSADQWSDAQRLKITISPPFWKTTYAMIIYFLIVALIIYISIRVILKMESLKHSAEIEGLERKNEKKVTDAKLQFFTNISHEIKTPLTLISGPIDMLTHRYQSNTTMFESLRLVQRQSKKISQLIDQVHDFQRSEVNSLKMHLSQFNFNSFINELVDDFNFTAIQEKKLLNVIKSNDSIYVTADKDKLEKIINNLLSNAFKYSKEGDTITIKFEVQEERLAIMVNDTGKGIEPDDLPFIFDRFYQSKKNSSVYIGGSGIGLAFSKRLVEMHNGNISVQSQLGKGTEMKVIMPVVITALDIVELEAQNNIMKDEKSFENANMLVKDFSPKEIQVSEDVMDTSLFLVEDNTELRLFISNILSQYFKVKEFVNGQECLEAMKEEWPDLIVSDVLMPELNGFDLCKSVKTNFKTSHIPIILLTACISDDDRIKGLSYGADAYISKPFNMNHLITRIETLLQSRKQLRERYAIDLPLSLAKEDSIDDTFMQAFFKVLEEHMDNPDFDITECAKILYLSRSNLYHKIKTITNQTPYDLLKALRLKKAAELLGKQKLSVNETFMMTGFKSRAHFTTVFKETYEVTPGKYAASVANKYAGDK